MSFSTETVTGGKEDLIVDMPAQGDAVGVNATPEVNLTAAKVSVDHRVYNIEIDCRDNPNENVTLRLFDSTSSPTVGTTDAHAWFPGIRGQITSYAFPYGIRFPTGVSAAVVQGQGGTAGDVNPSGTVRVQLRIKQG